MSYAGDTLLRYVRTLWQDTELQWNNDDDGEILSIIESIETNVEIKIEQAIKKELRTKDRRQKIASELLAGLITANSDYLNLESLVSQSVKLTDLLLEKLAQEPSK